MTVLRLAACVTVIVLCAACAHFTNDQSAAACAGPSRLDERILKTRLLVLGEMHGTSQVPQFAKKVVCEALARRSGPVVLLLELDSSQQALIADYLRSSGTTEERCKLLSHVEWAREQQDGRTSEAMFGLFDFIRSLRLSGHKLEVRAIAGASDREYASNIASALDEKPGALGVAILGNVHASKQHRARDGSNLNDPAVSLLEHYAPISLVMVSAGGTHWASLARKFGVHALDDDRDAGLAPGATDFGAVTLANITPVPGMQYDGYFGIGQATASLPGARLCR